MEKVILWIMACGAIVGGLDQIFGNRLKLGERFEQGFQLMGSTALSMVGILCLTPLLSKGLRFIASPICNALHIDPGIFGSILAIDMGGYQLCADLAQDARVGRYAGILVAAILGCTVTFTIPVGMGMVETQDRLHFARGMLFGLIAMPIALVLGGTMCGLTLAETLWNSLPIFILSLLLLLGIWKIPEKMIRGFGVFAQIIRILTTLGIILGAVTYMTGFQWPFEIAPIEDALAVVASIGIMMLGSLPAAELLQRALRRPLAWVGKRTGLNSASVAGLLIGMVSVLPAIALVRDMDKRGKIANAACMVCGASTFAAHLGFVAGVDETMILPLLMTKVLGGILGAVLALAVTRREN